MSAKAIKLIGVFVSILFMIGMLPAIDAGGVFLSTAHARSAATPWDPELGLQNLVYGTSSTLDVQNIMGRSPDDIVRTEQMYPVIENYYYFEEGGTGAATIFIFENNLLVGLTYKSPDNQMVDLTYFLPNNGDRALNFPALAGYRGYFPFYPLYNY